MAAYDLPTRLIHLGLAVLGIAALISGQFAEDYKLGAHRGFDIHSWIGLGMGGALVIRVLWGSLGLAQWRFSRWREAHPGIAGWVQAIGLLAFAWMAVSGAVLFAYLEPGSRAVGWVRVVKELHEGGQAVVIGYVVLHVGAVIAHSLIGQPIWRRMFGMADRP